MALLAGKPVGMIYPDQNAMGTLVIPNTAALINNCPHPENGRKLIDYLLSAEVESKLAFSASAQMPVRSDIAKPDNIPSVNSVKVMNADVEKIAERMEDVSKWLMQVFLR